MLISFPPAAQAAFFRIGQLSVMSPGKRKRWYFSITPCGHNQRALSMSSLKNLCKFGISASSHCLSDDNQSPALSPYPRSSPLPGFTESALHSRELSAFGAPKWFQVGPSLSRLTDSLESCFVSCQELEYFRCLLSQLWGQEICKLSRKLSCLGTVVCVTLIWITFGKRPWGWGLILSPLFVCLIHHLFSPSRG